MRGGLLERLILGALVWLALGGAACVEDDAQDAPEQEAERPDPTGFEGFIPTHVKSCDLRAEGALSLSNDVCGLCDMGGVEVWYWRAGDLCVWAFEAASLVPLEQARADCVEVGGELDHRTDTD
jgi:hypothetical protein